MAKATWINIGGTWKKVKNVWINAGGVWKQNVVPKGKVGGLWKEFIEYGLRIYEYGKEYINIVEGTSGNGTFTKYPDHFIVTGREATPKVAMTEIPVDLTDITTLYVEWEQSEISPTRNSELAITVNKTGYHHAARTLVYGGIPRRVDSLDVSTFSGEYYIAVKAGGNGTGNPARVTVYRLWGE